MAGEHLVGKAAVEIEPKLADGFIAKSADKINKETEKLGAGAGHAFSTALGVAAGQALYAGLRNVISSAGNFIKQGLLSAQDAQATSRRLEQVARNAGIAIGYQTDRIKEYAEALSRKISVDQSSVEATQAQLLTFSRVASTAEQAGGAFDRATAAAYDMAANGFGSAETAAEALGRALQNPVAGMGQLARAGVQLTDSQIKQVKSLVSWGKYAEAQEIILRAVEDAIGGAAEASVTATQKMSRAWNDLGESIGRAVLPAVEGFADFITPIIDKFSALSDPIKRTIIAIGAFGAAVLIAGPKLVEFKRAMDEMGIGLDTFRGKITKGRLALAGLVVGLFAMGQAVASTGGAKGKTFFDLGGDIDSIVDPAQRAKTALNDIIQPGFWNSIRNFGEGVRQTFGNIFGIEFRTSLDAAKEAVQGLDLQMAELARSTDAADRAQAKRMFQQQVADAKQYGATVQDVADVFDDYIKAAAAAEHEGSLLWRVTEWGTGIIERNRRKMEQQAEAAKRVAKALREARAATREYAQQVDDYRFEASLAGLDDVTAAVKRAQYAEENYLRVRQNAAKWGSRSVEDLARWQRKTAEAWAEWQMRLVDVDSARAQASRDAADEAKAAAEEEAARLQQLAEEAAQARKAIVDSLGGFYIEDLVKDGASGIERTLYDLAQRLRQDVGGSVGDGLAQMVDNGNSLLQAAANRRDAIVERLEAAQSKLQSLIEAKDALQQQLAGQSLGSIVGYANAAIEGVDRNPSPGVTLGAAGVRNKALSEIAARLQQRIQEIRKFAADIRKLAARGLPQFFLNELIQAGPDGGGPTAALLASSNDIYFNKIKSAAVSLYEESQVVAKQGSKIMYDAGIKSAQGLVEGLKKQEQAIQNQMIRIANMMVQTIRRALGIRSPSAVFAGLGENVGAGFVQGITSSSDAVRSATESLVNVPRVGGMAVGGDGAALGGNGLVVQHLEINNPAQEPASTSVAGGLRRAAFMLGRG